MNQSQSKAHLAHLPLTERRSRLKCLTFTRRHNDMSRSNVSPNESSWTFCCPLDDVSLRWCITERCVLTLDSILQWVITSVTSRNLWFPGALQATGKPKLCSPIPTHGPHQNCLASGLYLPDLTYPNICNGRPLAVRNGSYWDASSKGLIVQITHNLRHIVQGRNVQELSFRDTLFGD